jgi:DNA repair exonuclease SbcCD ATPase subunit
MKIIKLIAENFKILKAVEIEPGNNNTIIITGKNGAGKTSVLDAIAIAMAGKRAIKELKKAIREGEDKAFVTIETEKYIITRKWTQNDSGTLVVKDNEGRTYPSPQAFLDKIIGELTFDPLEFSLSKPQEHRQILINLIGQAKILAELNDKRQIAYNRRTDVNRELKSLKSRLDSLPKPDPSLENQNKKDVNELTKKLQDANKINTDAENIKNKIAQTEININQSKRKIEEIEEQITIEKKYVDDLKDALKNIHTSDISVVNQEFEDAIKLNKQLDEAFKYYDLEEEYGKMFSQSDVFSNEIDNIDNQKKQILAEAKFPITGLGFNEDGITFNDIPFQQCALSEQLKVSIAIAMATNPEFRVIRITDASLLDSDNLKIIQEMADKYDFQVWLEIVSDGQSDIGICIEEGEIISVNGKELKKCIKK